MPPPACTVRERSSLTGFTLAIDKKFAAILVFFILSILSPSLILGSRRRRNGSGGRQANAAFPQCAGIFFGITGAGFY